MASNRVDTFIEEAPEEQHEILIYLRKLIHEAVPDAKEQIKWGQPVFSTIDNFAYLKSNKSHVNLGFFNFDKLDDPENMLEGTGKRMRHVKIESAKDIRPDLFKQWFKTAAKE